MNKRPVRIYVVLCQPCALELFGAVANVWRIGDACRRCVARELEAIRGR